MAYAAVKFEDYIQISLQLLRRFSSALKFDIYVRRTDSDYTKLFKKGDSIDWERVALYEAKGIRYFFVTKDEYQIYSLFVERLGEQLTQSKDILSLDESLVVLKELSQFTIHELVVNFKIDDRLVNNANIVVEGCIKELGKDPKTLINVIKLLAHQPYILKHSMMVSMFSVILAKESGIESDLNLKVIGMGGFLHDIGVSQLTFDPEDEKFLTAEQRKEMWRHPELGSQLLDNLKGVRTEVIQIILQHHEQPNGTGYPNGLRGPEIYHPAKIVAIADAFCAMISQRSFRDALTIAQALVRLKELSGKFDKKLVDVFVKLMTPTPKA
ncbi:MAG: hypothetical protein Fur0010_10450 [Bdellovibrio sp.]